MESHPDIPEDFLTSFVLHRDGTTLFVSSPPARQRGENAQGPFAAPFANGTERNAIEEGSIRLACIGTAIEAPDPAWKRGNSYLVTPKYYTPDFKRISAAKIDGLLPREKQDLIVRSLPGARFAFASKDDVKPLWLKIFDARTHSPLARGSYLFRTAEGFAFDADLDLWHQTPVEITGFVATGPVRHYRLPAEPGAEIRLRGLAFKVLAVAEGEIRSGSSAAPPNGTSVFEISPAPGTPQLSVLLAVSTSIFNSPFDLEGLDPSGKGLAGYPQDMAAEGFVVLHLFGRREQLKELRVKHYPGVQRLALTLPELPGLPEENRGLKNLFDAHIPWLQLDEPFALQKNLGAYAQMNVQHLPGFIPNWRGAQIRSNTTPRALLDELRSRNSQEQYDRVVIDSEKNEIRSERPWLGQLMAQFKRLLGRR